MTTAAAQEESGASESLSLADALNQAWDEVENDREPADGETEGALEGAEEADPGEEDSTGEEDAGAPPLAAESGEPGEEGAQDSPPTEASGGDLEAPPAGLPPAAREAWAETPDAVKAAIAKREDDYSKGIQKYAQNARRAEQMDAALAPFQQFFAINGNNPAGVVRDVLATAATLQMGSPPQKAQAAARLIQQFGVDIGALDKVLAGTAPAAADNGTTGAIPPELQQQLSQMQQQLQSFQQRDQDTLVSEVQAFAAGPGKEFFADVRTDMADLMDAAERHGKKLTLQEAYDRACALHPEIGPILQARKTPNSAARRRAAASSVRGVPGASAAASESAPRSTREALERAFDAHS